MSASDVGILSDRMNHDCLGLRSVVVDEGQSSAAEIRLRSKSFWLGLLPVSDPNHFCAYRHHERPTYGSAEAAMAGVLTGQCFN